MKTLHIISYSYAPSTAGTNRILAIVKGLGELGINIKVLFIAFNPEFSKITECYPNTEFIHLWNKGGTNRRFVILRSYFKLLKYLRKGNNILVTDPAIMKLPLHWFKANLFHERTEHPDINRNNRSKINNFWNKCYLNNCRKLKGLFVITHNLKNYFESQGVQREKITVINMVVDPKRFENIPQSLSCEKYVAYCGKVSIGKDGVDYLIKSFKRVADTIRDVKLYIIGSFNTDDDRHILLNLVEKYNLSKRIVFTGQIPPTEMPEILSNAQVLVLARYNNKQAMYGFPTKLGEYLLSERPTVITRTGEIDLFLEDKKSALITEPGDIDSIADKIVWALHNTKDAQILAGRGKEVALSNFNYKIEAAKIADIVFNQ